MLEQGDFRTAADELERAFETEPQEAETALYEQATLRRQKLHERDRALSLFQLYRLRFSAGTFRPDVDFAIFQIRLERGEQGPALDEARDFLAQHSDLNVQADRVRMARGKLLSDRGDFVIPGWFGTSWDETGLAGTALIQAGSRR